MSDVDVKVLDIDNKEYFIVDNIIDKKTNINYYYFANKEDPKDYIVQKLASDNDSLLPIDTEEEFNNALNLLAEKYYN